MQASYHGEDGHEGGTRRLGAWGVRVSNEMTKARPPSPSVAPTQASLLSLPSINELR
jgi:hypothetical protein